MAVGFAVSFVRLDVVKTFLGYVQRHGFALFAWWRVIVGSLGLIALALGNDEQHIPKSVQRFSEKICSNKKARERTVLRNFSPWQLI